VSPHPHPFGRLNIALNFEHWVMNSFLRVPVTHAFHWRNGTGSHVALVAVPELDALVWTAAAWPAAQPHPNFPTSDPPVGSCCISIVLFCLLDVNVFVIVGLQNAINSPLLFHAPFCLLILSWTRYAPSMIGVLGRQGYTRLYPKVSGLAAWSEIFKWYSSLPLGAVVSLFSESF
jgi:hypothetical protein